MKRLRVLLSSIAGTALEFYDFMLYAVFSEEIGKAFFPQTVLSNFQAGWLAFALAYASRPFGATVFGYVGDKWGRKRALMLTIVLMGIPTFLMSVLPTYQEIGITASVLVIVCRLIQGLCAGGEYNGSAIFALEHMGKNYPGLSGGLITGASVIGALGATGMGILCTLSFMPSWWWRTSFALGALISLFGLYIRRFVSESPAFEAQRSKASHRLSLFGALKAHKKGAILTLSIGLLNGSLSYTLYKFINLYLKSYFDIPIHSAFQYTSIGIGMFIIGAPLWGFVLDKVGDTRILKVSCWLTIVSSVPLFFLLQELTVHAVILAQIILGICVSSIAGPEHAFIQKLFPVHARYTGVSFSFSCGIGIGAGLCPPLMKWLVDTTHNTYTPALILIMTATFCLICLTRYKGPYYKNL